MKLPFDSRYVLTALLIAAALLLLLVIGAELGWGERIGLATPQPKLQKNTTALPPLLPEFGLPPLDPTYVAIVERPLFVPTRRPPPLPPPPDQVKPAMRKGQFMLIGVILTKGKNIALLREIANGKVSRVEQGKEINGILVEKLEREKVTLKQWEDREEVVMKMAQPLQFPQPGQPGMPALAGQPPVPSTTGPPNAMPTDLQGLIARRRGLAP